MTMDPCANIEAGEFPLPAGLSSAEGRETLIFRRRKEKTRRKSRHCRGSTNQQRPTNKNGKTRRKKKDEGEPRGPLPSANSAQPTTSTGGPKILTLPRELYETIMEYMDVRTVARFGISCKTAWQASMSEIVWATVLRGQAPLAAGPLLNNSDAASSFEELARAAAPTPKNQKDGQQEIMAASRQWYWHNFVRMEGILGDYEYRASWDGSYGELESFSVRCQLKRGAFHISTCDYNDYSARSTRYRGKTVRWAGDHLVLEGQCLGSTYWLRHGVGQKEVSKEKTPWRSRVYLGALREQQLEGFSPAFRERDFEKNKGCLVLYIEGLEMLSRLHLKKRK